MSGRWTAGAPAMPKAAKAVTTTLAMNDSQPSPLYSRDSVATASTRRKLRPPRQGAVVGNLLLEHDVRVSDTAA